MRNALKGGKQTRDVINSNMAATSEFTFNDFKEFSIIYAAEFNRPEMHDRILVLDVFNDNIEDEINPESCVIKQEMRHLNDEVACSSSVCTRAMSKATEKQISVADLNASVSSVGKRKPFSVKRKASSDRVMTLRSRKVSKTDHDEFKVEDGIPPGPEKQQAIAQHKIFAHSSWLSVHSNYFRALFYSGLKESHLKEVHLKIPKSEEAAHLHLIGAMYSLDILNNRPVSELIQILVLADKYDAKFVFRKCKYVLKTKVESVKLCEEIYNVVKVEHRMVNVEDLIDTIQNFLAKEFQPLDEKWESSSFENLSEPFLTLLLGSDKLIVSCEDVVFHALMHWIKNNAIFAKDASKDVPKLEPELLSASRLLSVVRFELLTTTYLLSVVQHHPIAKQMANFNECYLKAVHYLALPNDVLDNALITIDAPDERLTQKADIVHFRWKMPDKEILKALTRLHSQPFWACGYRMQLSLRRKFNYDDEFFVVITLKILSLKEGGFTSVDWNLKYKGLSIFQDDYYDYEYVLTCDSPERKKEGSFKWIGPGSCVLKLIMRPCHTSVDFN